MSDKPFVALEFPPWLRWGVRKGAYIDGAAQAAVYPDSRYWTPLGHLGSVWRCCWCAVTLTGRRRAWCGDACKDRFYRVWSWGALATYIVERDAGICQRCGTDDPGEPKGNRYSAWEVDHIVRVVDGGTDDPANLRLLCATCHVAVGYEQRASRKAPLEIPA